MSPTAMMLLLYVAGVMLLLAELTIPSYGLLTIGALVCFGFAIGYTFSMSTIGGVIGIIACLAGTPAVLILGIKYVQYLPFGDQIAPPNPEPVDHSVRTLDDPRNFIGRRGKVVSTLRPVGLCEFDGRRVYCVAEGPILEPGTHVVGVGMDMSNLLVRGDSAST